MEAKLKLILRKPQSLLVLKSAIFAGFLFLLKLGDFGILPILFFLWAVFMMARGAQASFLVFLFVSAALVNILDRPLFLVLALIGSAGLFYLTVGIQELIIIRRPEWLLVRNTFLFYIMFLLFFLADKSSWFLFKYLAVFLAAWLILREWFLPPEDSLVKFIKRPALMALALAFIVLQFLWAVALLPLGPVNSASLMTLIAYILFDFARHHFQGKINRQLVLRHFTIFILLLILIFATTQWGIR
ncbi:MAG: hypothetical protein Q8P76_03620 [bacterium]|nr:hypothetical protein [bacterium]